MRKAPVTPPSDGSEFAKGQNFFFRRNQDLFLFFCPGLGLILCCCFFLRLNFFRCFCKNVFGSFAIPNSIGGVITNLQSLNPMHTGQPIVG